MNINLFILMYMYTIYNIGIQYTVYYKKSTIFDFDKFPENNYGFFLKIR